MSKPITLRKMTLKDHAELLDVMPEPSFWLRFLEWEVPGEPQINLAIELSNLKLLRTLIDRELRKFKA